MNSTIFFGVSGIVVFAVGVFLIITSKTSFSQDTEVIANFYKKLIYAARVKKKILISFIVTIFICAWTFCTYVNIPIIVKINNFVSVRLFSSIDKKKFDNLYRSIKTIEGAIAVGVNYQKFCEMVQQLSAEISITKEISKNGLEKELLENGILILSVYHDSATLWGAKIDHSRYEWLPSGGIWVLGEGKIKNIVNKYKLDISTNSKLYQKYGWTDRKARRTDDYEYISGDSVQVVWKHATVYIEKFSNIYNN